MKKSYILLLLLPLAFRLPAQRAGCTFKSPTITIHFGTANVPDLNKSPLYNYERISGYCPSDGYYTYTSYTSGCFRDDWFTLAEDHTVGDVDGNMMLVNGSREAGVFLTTTLNGLKSSTEYEFAAWMMNLCKITRKCPFPLLPVISVRLTTPDGKMVAQFSTGELNRGEAPEWSRHNAFFTTLPGQTPLILTMADNSPGGCGNDFALDDITFRECIRPKPVVVTPAKVPVTAKKQALLARPVLKRSVQKPVRKPSEIATTANREPDNPTPDKPAVKPLPRVATLPPSVLTTRANPLIKQIETEAGEIRLDLYDNGDIDGDSVSIFHNNSLLVQNARLTQKPISFRIVVDPDHPHHELIMVANNLGSIPPNTSMMVVTAGGKRYEVFISSNEQRNAKVVLDLKK